MWIHLLTLRLIKGAGAAAAVVAATTTPGGVHRGRFLRRGPKLPWDIEETQDEQVVIAKPRRKRIRLPAEVRAAVEETIPIQATREIPAPWITVPGVGTATLVINDDEEQAVLMAILQ
ncbi:MAG TPA: hypothetical protein VLM19_05235 [Nitrospiraceae bacterium]|nr:hypothetical protein [Nitrospiraceae bacterium]